MSYQLSTHQIWAPDEWSGFDEPTRTFDDYIECHLAMTKMASDLADCGYRYIGDGAIMSRRREWVYESGCGAQVRITLRTLP